MFTSALIEDVSKKLMSTVPEPSTWAMMIVGFGGLGFLALRAGGRRDCRLNRERETSIN